MIKNNSPTSFEIPVVLNNSLTTPAHPYHNQPLLIKPSIIIPNINLTTAIYPTGQYHLKKLLYLNLYDNFFKPNISLIFNV